MNSNNRTCLLPFVLKPCLINKQNLSCTFSLDSSERTRDCRLPLKILIFTTYHVELFLIATYYDLIFQHDQRIIHTLIIEPNVTNCTFEYLHWTEIRILSIEFSAENYQFALIHQKNILDIHRVQNHFNRTYWHLQIMPGMCETCERTIFTRNHSITTLYQCPHMTNELNTRLCGHSYACFHNQICHATGYQRLVCLVNIVRPWMKFYGLATIQQYEIVFISSLQSFSNSFHVINETSFMIDESLDYRFTFQTKHLVVVIDKGILHLSSRLFNYHEKFSVRIEHGRCGVDGFRVDILNETSNSISNNLISLENITTDITECQLNISDPVVISHYKPSIIIENISRVSIEKSSPIYIYTVSILPLINISLFNNNSLDRQSSIEIDYKYFYDNHAMISILLSNITKYENGTRREIIVSNRFGQTSASFLLDVAYAPVFIVPPKDQIVQRGSDVIFEILIDGNPPPNVFVNWWNFEKQLYSTPNNSTLYQYKISNVQLNASTLYNFSIRSDIYNRTSSVVVVLTVLDILYPINGTNNRTIEEDEDLHIVILFSHSVIRTQWFVNDTFIQNTLIDYNESISDAQVILIIKNTSIKHTGQYKVQVWDIINQTNHSSITVHINSIPPTLISCNNGSNSNEFYLCITCRFQGKYPEIQWFDPNNEILFGQYDIFNETAHIYEAKIIFTKIHDRTFGLYTFQVTNHGGHLIHRINFPQRSNNENPIDESKFDFSLEIFPRIGNHSFQLKRIFIHQNASHSFYLHFTGIPWPNVTLFFNDRILFTYTTLSTSPVWWNLSDFTSDYEGIYYARVMNNQGFIETNRTEICLFHAPIFIIENQTVSSSIVSVRTNQTITLITPKIKPGIPDALKAVWFVKGCSIRMIFNSTTPYLQLTINSSLQQEHIVCMIENRFGENAYFFKLNFHQIPSFQLALNKQIEIDLNETMTLTVNIIGNPSPFIQWFHNQQNVDHQRFEEHNNIYSGIYSLVIRNLTLIDLGDYSVVATNSEGQISSETQIVLKSSYFNRTTSQSTISSETTCRANTLNIIIIFLLVSVLLILIIPIVYHSNRCLTLFNCRKKQFMEISSPLQSTISNID